MTEPQTAASVTSGVPIGDDTTPSINPWRDSGCLACTGWTNDSGKTPVHAAGCRYEAMVKRGADALATWVNPTWRIGWAEGAARVVLDAALGTQPKASEGGRDERA